MDTGYHGGGKPETDCITALPNYHVLEFRGNGNGNSKSEFSISDFLLVRSPVSGLRSPFLPFTVYLLSVLRVYPW